MLGNIFGGKPKESWSDRAKAHRASLKADQEAATGSSRGSRGNASEDGRGEKPARTRKSGGQGFGKRS